MGKDVIVACDFSSAEQVFSFLDKFTEEKPFVKIGMELFYAEGPQIVRDIKARGHKIFLDLKLHDIPNTVMKAMKVLSGLDVDMVNIHAAGTTAMMEGALKGLTREDGSRPMLIAVTQLTSTDQQSMEKDLLINEPIDKVVMHYALTAKNAGLDGVVCSPLESGKVHDVCGAGFVTVTPGVRFAENDTGGGGAHQHFDLGVVCANGLSQCIFHMVSHFGGGEGEAVVAVYGAFDAAGPCKGLFRTEEYGLDAEQIFCNKSLYIGHFNILQTQSTNSLTQRS